MLGYRCEYWDKRFTNAIDVVRHSVDLHPGRSIVQHFWKVGLTCDIGAVL